MKKTFFRVILLTMLITTLFVTLVACDNNSDNQVQKAPATVSYSVMDDDNRVSVISKIIISFEDDLSTFSADQVSISLRALDNSFTAGYIPQEIPDHSFFEGPLQCQVCHFPTGVDGPDLSLGPWHLVYNSPEKDVLGTVSINGNDIIFNPSAPLDHARNYQVSILASLDGSENQLTTQVFNFKTHENPEKRRVRYTAGQVISSRETLPAISTGNTYVLEYDVQNNIIAYTKNVINSQKLIKKIVYYASAGIDGDWLLVGDNGVKRYVDIIYNNENALARYVVKGVGNDLVVDTEDDVMLGYVDFKYDTKGQLLTTLMFDGAGLNGVWLDEDDSLIGTYSKLVLQAEFPNRKKIVRYNSAGGDGLWNTHDDMVYAYTEVILQDDGKELRRSTYLSPGDSGIWFTEDDVRSQYSITDYYPAGMKKTTTDFDDTDTLTSKASYLYNIKQQIENTKYETTGGIYTTDFIYEPSFSLLTQVTWVARNLSETVSRIEQTDYSYNFETGRTLNISSFIGGADVDLTTLDDNEPLKMRAF